MILRTLLSAPLAVLLLAVSPAVAGDAPIPWNPAEKLARRGVPEARVPVPDFTRLPPAEALPTALVGSIRRVDLPPGEKLVALTFDLCETSGEVAGYDGAIVDTLRRRDAHATFFVGGHWATTHAARFRELAADSRFELENHTWSHANLRLAEGDRLAREILAPEAAFAALAGRPRSRLLRFPFGACDARSMAAVNAAGMAAIQWDVSTGDPTPSTSAAAIVSGTLAAVRPGSIVLAHANGRGWHTAEALPRLIDELTARGYRLVTVGELLEKGRPVISPTCWDSRPGDTDRYDHWPFAVHRPVPAAPPAGGTP